MRYRSIFMMTVVIVIACLQSSCEKEKFCTTYSIALNKVSPYYDGQWQGILAASDGACYFGASCHSLIHGGGFFRFDPVTKQFDVLVEDFTTLVGTDLSKNTPQGKVHSPIIEIDGTLYLSTHLAAYWDDVLDKYEGSHILSYNMAEKKWRDYGVVRPRFSTYSAVEVDAKRGKIYAMIVPFAPDDKKDGDHLYQIDIKSGEKRDLGRVSDGKGVFWFYLDNTGKLWFPVWRSKNTFHCYDPETDSITFYENAFPEPKYAPDGSEVEWTIVGKGRLSWTWATPIDGGAKCIFTMGDYGGGDERLWIFDPSKDIKSKEAFTPVKYIGNTFLSVALGGNRLYFVQFAEPEKSRGWDTELYRGLSPDKNGYYIHNLHLKSVSLNPNDKHPFIDHGRIIDQDGRTPSYIGSLAADDKGNVYIDGSWLLKPGDQPVLQYQYKPMDGKEFKELKFGQFFAWVNVSKDIN